MMTKTDARKKLQVAVDAYIAVYKDALNTLLDAGLETYREAVESGVTPDEMQRLMNFVSMQRAERERQAAGELAARAIMLAFTGK